MKSIDLAITLLDSSKAIYNDPFDEVCSAKILFTCSSEKKKVWLSSSTTGGSVQEPCCEWKGFNVKLLNADVYGKIPSIRLEVRSKALAR